MSGLTLWPRTLPWAGHDRPPPTRRRASSPGIQATSDAVGVGDERETERACCDPARRSTPGITSSTASEPISVDRFGAPLDDRDLGDELLAFGARRAMPTLPVAERLGETVGERAELEELEQPLDLVGLRLDRQRVEVDAVERRVAPEHHQIEVLARPAPRAR